MPGLGLGLELRLRLGLGLGLGLRFHVFDEGRSTTRTCRILRAASSAVWLFLAESLLDESLPSDASSS